MPLKIHAEIIKLFNFIVNLSERVINPASYCLPCTGDVSAHRLLRRPESLPLTLLSGPCANRDGLPKSQAGRVARERPHRTPAGKAGEPWPPHRSWTRGRGLHSTIPAISDCCLCAQNFWKCQRTPENLLSSWRWPISLSLSGRVAWQQQSL